MPKRGVIRRWRAKLRKEQSGKNLGKKLAPHVVAIARQRVDASALDTTQPDKIASPSVLSHFVPGSQPMPVNLMRDMMRRRWQSEYPFAGMATNSIVRKVMTKILTQEARTLAMRELNSRGYNMKELR